MPVFLVERTEIVLLSREGMSDIGKALLIDPDTVRKWRKRFIAYGVEGLPDRPNSGKPRSYGFKEGGARHPECARQEASRRHFPVDRQNDCEGACHIRGHRREDTSEGRHKALDAQDLVREQRLQILREGGGGHMVVQEPR
ncbi:MAG: helix-turn-helix domain-containing protein [Deltaproteobacteria bacterium]|nr:helix-turn-helix domain-containing protein [Deltaproteobacteria bacterium]